MLARRHRRSRGAAKKDWCPLVAALSSAADAERVHSLMASVEVQERAVEGAWIT